MAGPPRAHDDDHPASTPSVDELLAAAYDDLRARAKDLLRSERVNHTLQPTAVVHEAYAKLAVQDRARWQNREQFEAVAAVAMRRILVDHARTKQRAKRGGGDERLRVTLSDLSSDGEAVDLLVLDETLERLRTLDPRQHKIVELRFFGGLDERAIAERLGASRTTVQTEWRIAKAWLATELRAARASDDEPPRDPDAP